MSLLAHRFDGPAGAPIVLLLNGGLMTMAVWDPIAAALSTDFRVLRCDLRGQILSPGRVESVDAHVGDVLRLLDAAGVEPAHLAGVSYGSFVAIKVAAAAPSRVRSLVAMNSTPVLTDAMWQAGLPVVEACRAAAEGRGDGGRMFEELVPGTFSPSYVAANGAFLESRARQFGRLPREQFQSFLDIFLSLRGLDLRADAARVAVPSLVIGARGDETFAEPASSDLARAIPGAELTFVDGPHGVVLENPAALIGPLSSFLRRQS